MSAHPINTAASSQRIKLVKNPNFSKDAIMAYGHALRKFGIKPTLEGPFKAVDELFEHGNTVQRLHNRVRGKPNYATHRKIVRKDAVGQTAQAGHADSQNIHNDSEYLAQCWSTELPKSIQAQSKTAHHNIYDHAKSSTFKPSEGQKWQITYGDGSSASGLVGTDTVNIGGLEVKNQSVEMANKLSPEFQEGAGDGLLGLAWGSINTVMPHPVKTPVENMMMQSAVKPGAEVFSCYLGGWKDANDPDKGQSFYTFGYIDQDVVKSAGSELYYAKIDNKYGFWQFPSTSYTVNSASHPLAGGSAIADTGTTLALVDDQMCKTIYAAIPGSKLSSSFGGYIYPTTTSFTSLPTIQLDIGGKLFRINKEDLGYADIGNGMTYGGIQSRGDLPFSIYGDTFLKNVYAVFDVGQKRFGCVQRVDPDAPSAQASSAEPSQLNSQCSSKYATGQCEPTCKTEKPDRIPTALPTMPNSNILAPAPSTQPPAANPNLSASAPGK